MKNIAQNKYLWIISAIPVFILYCWLNWGLLPNLAIIHLDGSGDPLPKAGYLLVYKEGSHLAVKRVIDSLEKGWSGVAAAWPYTLGGIMIGFLPGMVSSEASRRIYENATREAQAKAEEIKKEAWEKMSDASHLMANANKMKADASELFDAAANRRKENQAERQEIAGMKLMFEGKLKYAESTANELKKARNKIRRLEDKIERLEGNSIDWP
jgi:hypothetical protein